MSNIDKKSKQSNATKLLRDNISPTPWKVKKTTVDGSDFIEIQDANDKMICFTEHTSKRDEANFELLVIALEHLLTKKNQDTTG